MKYSLAAVKLRDRPDEIYVHGSCFLLSLHKSLHNYVDPNLIKCHHECTKNPKQGHFLNDHYLIPDRNIRNQKFRNFEEKHIEQCPV